MMQITTISSTNLILIAAATRLKKFNTNITSLTQNQCQFQYLEIVVSISRKTTTLTLLGLEKST